MKFRDLSFRTALALLASAVTTAALLVLALMLAFQFMHSWDELSRQRAIAGREREPSRASGKPAPMPKAAMMAADAVPPLAEGGSGSVVVTVSGSIQVQE